MQDAEGRMQNAGMTKSAAFCILHFAFDELLAIGPALLPDMRRILPRSATVLRNNRSN
jgi:hypothetical protein